MAKNKSLYVCQNCSNEVAKWMGQCPACGEWNTLVETIVAARPNSGGLSARKGSLAVTPVRLSTVKTKETKRMSSKFEEFDRVLGGGFVSGQVILLAGEPGVGKSTLLTQLAKNMTGEVCYVAGEESPQQIKLRSERMKYSGENLSVISETNVDIIYQTLSEMGDLDLIIVDSIQTLTNDSLSGIAGSVGQVRLAAQTLAQLAKRLGVPMILVGHVTKEGSVAGPKVLEHLVDTVLQLEGDSQHMFRILKTAKNRFGAVSEVGIFEMEGTGLREVKNPSELFLSFKNENISGSCATVVMEGFRPMLFEIQALTTKTSFGYPRRTASGFSATRLQVLIAILEKRAGLNLSNHDVYVNVAGGFRVSEYACDLAVCLAIASSLKDKPLKVGTVAFGECGLLGEIRRVSNADKRAKEAKKIGYSNVIDPESVKYLGQALTKAFGKTHGKKRNK